VDNRLLGDPGTDAFQVGKYPFFLLNRLVGRYNSVISERLRAVDLDIPSWRVLMILGESEPRGVRDIADSAVIPLSTMTRMVQRMTSAGLVEVTGSQVDGRVTEVRLTDRGRTKLVEARFAAAPVYAAVIDGVSANEFDALIQLLDTLYANLGSLA
jgi:DNA-binding MarR family transcriptional regulator